MSFWQALVVVLVPSVAAVLTAVLGFRDLGMRRRFETSKQFLNLFATAHGRPVDGRDSVGFSEQVATIYLIADFAASETLLVNAAREGLKDFAAWDQEVDGPTESILPSVSQRKIAQAARDALKSLG